MKTKQTTPNRLAALAAVVVLKNLFGGNIMNPMQRIPRFNRLGALAAMAAFVILTPVTQAQTLYDWQTTAPDGNWMRGINNGPRWNPGTLWDAPPVSQDLRFNNDTYTTMTNNVTSYNVHKIWFGSSATQTRTIAGNDLAFVDYSTIYPLIVNDTTVNQTISLNITGSPSYPLELRVTSGNLTLNGTLNNNGQDLHVLGNNSHTLTLGGDCFRQRRSGFGG